MFSRNIIYRMGGSTSRAVDGAVHTVRRGLGSFGNDVDSIGQTDNWRDSTNTPYRIGTTLPFAVEGGNTWGAHPTPYGHIFGDTFMAKTKPVNKNITKHQDTTAHHSKHIPHVQPSESKHNTTHHKKK